MLIFALNNLTVVWQVKILIGSLTEYISKMSKVAYPQVLILRKLSDRFNKTKQIRNNYSKAKTTLDA